MALSNILREPKREIIETVFGLGVACVYFYVDYLFAYWIADQGNTGLDPLPWGVGFIISFILFWLISFVLFIILLLIHSLGDSICNGLSEIGYDPRPRQRY